MHHQLDCIYQTAHPLPSPSPLSCIENLWYLGKLWRCLGRDSLPWMLTFFPGNQVVSFYRNNYVQTIGHRVHCSNWFYYNWGFCGCILFNCLNDSFSLLHDSSTLSFILRVRKKCHARWYISPHPLLNHVQMIKAYKHPKPPQQQSPYDIHVSSCFYQAHFSHWRFFFTKMQDDCEAHRAQHGQLHCERAATPPGWVPPPPTWLWVKTLQDKDETGRRGFTTPRML